MSDDKKLFTKRNIIMILVLYFLWTVAGLICYQSMMTAWLESDIKTRGSMLIRGNSMTPQIEDNQIVYIQDVNFERGEIVVAIIPETENYHEMAGISMIKRIIGLPGEHIELTNEGVLINGKLLEENYVLDIEKTLDEKNTVTECVLSDNEYYLIGDNRTDSFDSRNLGAIPAENFLYGITIEPNEHTNELIAKRNENIFISLALILIMKITTIVLFLACEFIKMRKITKYNRSKKK